MSNRGWWVSWYESPSFLSKIYKVDLTESDRNCPHLLEVWSESCSPMMTHSWWRDSPRYMQSAVPVMLISSSPVRLLRLPAGSTLQVSNITAFWIISLQSYIWTLWLQDWSRSEPVMISSLLTLGYQLLLTRGLIKGWYWHWHGLIRISILCLVLVADAKSHHDSGSLRYHKIMSTLHLTATNLHFIIQSKISNLHESSAFYSVNCNNLE